MVYCELSTVRKKLLLLLTIVHFSFSLVYDTSNRDSFNKLEEWLNEVEVYSTKRDIIKMLVGNKIDKVSKNNL